MRHSHIDLPGLSRGMELGAVVARSVVLTMAVACGSHDSSANAIAEAGPADASTTTDSPASDDASADGDSAADPTIAQRESCTFQPGAKAAVTMGDSNLAAAQQKVGHVIVMMKENRSFDEIYGGLAQAGKTGVDLAPAGWSNPDSEGGAVAIFHATNTCYGLDPEHQGAQMVLDWDNGKMDGFVKNAQANSDNPVANTTNVPTDGRFVMAEYQESDLPFYYFLAKTYALADHYHCSALSGTWANRLYSVAASSYGVVNTGTDFPPALAGKLIFDALDGAKVTWGVYSDSASPLEYTFVTNPLNPAHVHPTAQFFTDLTAGTLPSVVFVEGNSVADDELGSTDEHPPADLHVGEAWSRTVYSAVTSSSIWYDKTTGSSTALLWTYDENGSFADHVPPPAACPPADVTAADSLSFSHYGPRVPFVVISPYARAGYVSHATHSHTSMLRLIEAVWNLGALTVRDANSDALLDMFDFGAPDLASPPAAPNAGTGTCSETASP